MNRRNIRHRMWQENPYCYWCGIKTRLMKTISPPPPKSIPFNFATLDHLFNKWEIENKKFSKLVIACYACNHSRGSFDFGKISFFRMLKATDFTMSISYFIKKKIHFYYKSWFSDYYDQFKNSEQYTKKLKIRS